VFLFWLLQPRLLSHLPAPQKISISEYRQTAIDSKTASHQLPQYVIDKKKAKLAVLPPGDATQYRNVCGLGQAAQENFSSA
jgi:hypothetical protein